MQSGEGAKYLLNLLFSTAMILGLAMIYYFFRELTEGSYADGFIRTSGFVERAGLTVALAVCGVGLLRLNDRWSFSFLKVWGIGLFHFGMFRLLYFDLLLYFPWFNASQFVGNWPLINGVSLTYGTGALLSAWAVFRLYPGEKENGTGAMYKLFGFILLFVLSSLTVRQLFHGGNLAVAGEMVPAEFYSYSLGWLITGLVLLAIGILKRIKSARFASLIFLVLTVGKVFLFDAAELEGLFRVFSFLGLGVSLIGLSYFYTRFVFANETMQKERNV